MLRPQLCRYTQCRRFHETPFCTRFIAFADGAESGRVWRIDDEGFYE